MTNNFHAPLSGAFDESGTHHYPIRVHWENTDAGGVVYHSWYLNFAERARTEMLRLKGIEQQNLRNEEKIIFAVTQLCINYIRSARLDDVLVVESRIKRLGAAVLEIDQLILLNDSPCARLGVTVACLCADTNRPKRLPRPLRLLLESHEQWAQ